tara:strand:+ start:4920 stop:5732 length:813 start_codon:yes stop_codon:yes gene_type:complete
MNYLVLGSSGQVGSALVNFLKSKGEFVLEFDLVNGCHQDLRTEGAVDHAIEMADFVFFLAFDVGGSRYLNKYQHNFNFISNNTALQLHTFKQLKRHNKPFIYASSQMSSMSFSPYGSCKSIGEAFTKSLNGLIVKFWNVYGLEHDSEKFHVITDFINKARNENQINMLTSGEEERQFLYSKDCGECLYSLSKLYNEIPRDEDLHVTSFEWTKIIDIAKIVSSYFDDCGIIPSEEKDSVQMGVRNEPNDAILKYWQPRIDINTGIKKIIEL